MESEYIFLKIEGIHIGTGLVRPITWEIGDEDPGKPDSNEKKFWSPHL